MHLIRTYGEINSSHYPLGKTKMQSTPQSLPNLLIIYKPTMPYSDISCQVTFVHICDHQDLSSNSQLLPWLAQLNILADYLIKAHLELPVECCIPSICIPQLACQWLSSHIPLAKIISDPHDAILTCWWHVRVGLFSLPRALTPPRHYIWWIGLLLSGKFLAPLFWLWLSSSIWGIPSCLSHVPIWGLSIQILSM